MLVPVDTQGRKNPGADAAATLVARTAIIRVVGPLVLRHVAGTDVHAMSSYRRAGAVLGEKVSIGKIRG